MLRERGNHKGATTTIPPVLHVSTEARQYAMEFYTKTMDREHKPFYIDFDNDAVFFKDDMSFYTYCLSAVTKNMMQSVQHALVLANQPQNQAYHKSILELLAGMASLKTVVLERCARIGVVQRVINDTKDEDDWRLVGREVNDPHVALTTIPELLILAAYS
ncbi:hypothetical protein BDZ45DRAFT_693027 [Acephala macrosclerotiorum]|nr:hypothetical protein BDZ45DRAFT_693027 [Acephala macrosclerotiorum]